MAYLNAALKEGLSAEESQRLFFIALCNIAEAHDVVLGLWLKKRRSVVKEHSFLCVAMGLNLRLS